MGNFSNKFLGAFKSDKYDDDYDDDYYDDDYDTEEDRGRYQEKRSNKSGGLFNKFKSSVSRDYDDYDDDYDDEYDDEPRQEEKKNYSFNKAPSKPAPQHRGSSGGNEVCVIKPSSIDDSREITETLLNGKACIINFEGLHVEISQRIIDFISGSCYALDGSLQKISNYIFIATPNSVELSGDFQDILGAATNSNNNAFDIAGFKSPLL